MATKAVINEIKKDNKCVIFPEGRITDTGKKEMSDFAKSIGIGELSVPKNIKAVDKLPLLGTGKIDYMAV
jgi:acyl-[acyl-carrier-protein]-phospholipid O-acyltransferase/long-chain-fatty-acid--[acyl-carrier-protein] ligase